MKLEDVDGHVLEVEESWKNKQEVILSLRQVSIHEWGQTFFINLSLKNLDMLISELNRLKDKIKKGK